MTRRTRDELAADVAALESSLAEVIARLEDVKQRADALAEQKAKVDGEANLARRAVADFEERIAEQRKALAAAEKYEQACRARDAAVRRRDAAGESLASTVHDLLERLDELTAARSEVAAAQDDLRRRFSWSEADIPREPPEPPGFVEAWTALRQRLQVERTLEDELLEAAAGSPLAAAVDKLPPHLRDAGRRRWAERRRESQQK